MLIVPMNQFQLVGIKDRRVSLFGVEFAKSLRRRHIYSSGQYGNFRFFKFYLPLKDGATRFGLIDTNSPRCCFAIGQHDADALGVS